LFACGECAAGINGANRLGGNSLSDLLVLGKRAGEYAVNFANENGPSQINPDHVDTVTKEALKPFDRTHGAAATEGPYQIQNDLQELMQNHVGIVRNEGEMREALVGIKQLWERFNNVSVEGNRDFNPGWHTALDLSNLLTVSEAITQSALERKESRGAHFREDYPQKEESFGKFNVFIQKDGDGNMQVKHDPIPPMPDELKKIIEEMK
jgi:succinate dehydrogenase / fumarate reductase flavoprotein subunit